jgi:hypothetical protein
MKTAGQTGRLIRQPDQSTFSENEEGVSIATEVFICPWRDMPRLRPIRKRSPHPDFNYMTCSEVSAVRIKGGMARLSVTYTGIDTGNTGTPDRLPDPVRSWFTTAEESPIETNKRFTTMIAGTPSEPQNGAKFDDVSGAFREFGTVPQTGAPSEFIGVQSFLSPRTVYQLVEVSLTEPSVGKVGTRNSPPRAPNLPSGIDWLLIEDDAEQDGKIWRRTRSWMASGEDGWMPVVYDPS